MRFRFAILVISSEGLDLWWHSTNSLTLTKLRGAWAKNLPSLAILHCHREGIGTDMIRFASILSVALILFTISEAENWPQGSGPNYDFTTSVSSPTDLAFEWSASFDQNILWKTNLPETGQSAPVIWGDRIFVTTMKPVDQDSETGKDIVAWCLSKEDGEILWRREIPGGYVTRLSAPFGDASSPAAVTDGKLVWFLNPTGKLTCFDFEGNEQWSKEVKSVSRTNPVLFDGKLIFHRQVYSPDDDGKFPHKRAETGKHTWTQLQAVDAKSGDIVWISECGVNMGCVPLVQKLNDGTHVMVVGRGGGHGPPETPDGVSMIRADNGKTLWTLELPQFMSTQTYPVVDNLALIFHKGDHLWVSAITGKITRQVSIVNEVPVRRWIRKGDYKTVTENLPEKKPRSITQQSNLRVGNFHYFRSYTANYLGRVNIRNGKTEYLELPLQVLREPGNPDQILWNMDQLPDEKRKTSGKKKMDLTSASLRPNQVKNSRGMVVMGDIRSVKNGWGHTASPIATAFGNHLIVPLLSGMVFVVEADAETFDEKALIAINDLGPLGETFTRASLTTDGTNIFGHTIQGIIAIGKK